MYSSSRRWASQKTVCFGRPCDSGCQWLACGPRTPRVHRWPTDIPWRWRIPTSWSGVLTFFVGEVYFVIVDVSILKMVIWQLWINTPDIFNVLFIDCVRSTCEWYLEDHRNMSHSLTHHALVSSLMASLRPATRVASSCQQLSIKQHS